MGCNTAECTSLATGRSLSKSMAHESMKAVLTFIPVRVHLTRERDLCPDSCSPCRAYLCLSTWESPPSPGPSRAVSQGCSKMIRPFRKRETKLTKRLNKFKIREIREIRNTYIIYNIYSYIWYPCVIQYVLTWYET